MLQEKRLERENRMSRKAKIEFFLGLGVFIASLAVYLRTMTPKLGWIDCGELTVVCATLGVAHPTGYPLYTLLGRLFALLPLGEVCQRVSLLSGFFAALGAVLAFLAVARANPPSPERLAGGVAAGLLLAFSATYWSQAVDQEVYSLTACLIALVIYAVFRWADRPSQRGLAFLAFLGGLALGNHLTAMWTGVAALLFVLWTGRKAVLNKGLWIYLVLFALGLSLYLSLVLRAGCNPLLSWGDVRTLRHLLWHLSAKQYRVWMFASDTATLSANAGRFLSLWIAQVTPWAFGLGALGAIALLWRSRSRLGFLALVFAIHTFFALNYSIPDIDSYFIPAFLVWALLCGEGVAWLLGLLGRKAKSRGLVRAARLVLPLVFLAPLSANWKENDLSRNYLPYDFGQNALASAEPGALVLTINWDLYSPILYIQNIEGTRRDVVMVDKELLRRSWYFKALGEQHPWLLQGSREEVRSYLALLDEFEAGTLKDNTEIQRRFIALINRFIHLGLAEGRPVYLAYNQAMDQTDFPGTAPDLAKIPCGLLYRLLPGDSLVESRPAFELRGVFDPGIYKDERTRVNLSHYPKMGFERAMFLATHRRYAEAGDILKGLLSWPINRVTVLRTLGGCELETGNLDEAQSAFEEMLREDPLDPVAKSGLEEILRRRQAAPGAAK